MHVFGMVQFRYRPCHRLGVTPRPVRTVLSLEAERSTSSVSSVLMLNKCLSPHIKVV